MTVTIWNVLTSLWIMIFVFDLLVLCDSLSNPVSAFMSMFIETSMSRGAFFLAVGRITALPLHHRENERHKSYKKTVISIDIGIEQVHKRLQVLLVFSGINNWDDVAVKNLSTEALSLGCRRGVSRAFFTRCIDPSASHIISYSQSSSSVFSLVPLNMLLYSLIDAIKSLKWCPKSTPLVGHKRRVRRVRAKRERYLTIQQVNKRGQINFLVVTFLLFCFLHG